MDARQCIMSLRTWGICPWVHFNELELALITKLTQSPMKPACLLPELHLSSAKSLWYLSQQYLQHFLAVCYPEVKGKTSKDRIQIINDVLQIPSAISTSQLLHFILKGPDLCRLNTSIRWMYQYSKEFYSFIAMTNMGLFTIDRK